MSSDATKQAAAMSRRCKGGEGENLREEGTWGYCRWLSRRCRSYFISVVLLLFCQRSKMGASTGTEPCAAERQENAA